MGGSGYFVQTTYAKFVHVPFTTSNVYLLHDLATIRQEVRSNLPYVRDSFREAMDDIVHEAKTEAESFIRQRAKSLGIDSAEMLSLPETSALNT